MQNIEGKKNKNGEKTKFLGRGDCPIYTSIIGLNCTSSITKMPFFDFSLENICRNQKIVVPLHAFFAECERMYKETRET